MFGEDFSGLDDSFLTRTERRLRARVCGDCAVIVIRVYPYRFCITLSYN